MPRLRNFYVLLLDPYWPNCYVSTIIESHDGRGSLGYRYNRRCEYRRERRSNSGLFSSQHEPGNVQVRGKIFGRVRRAPL